MQLHVTIGAFLLAAFFFGAFTVLIIFSTYTVLTSCITPRAKLSKAGLTLLMYAIAAGHLAGSITMFSRDKDIGTYNLLEQTLMILGVVNYVVSDAVVVWRCWLLWGRKHWVLMVPVVLFIATFAGAIAFVIFDVKALVSANPKDKKKTINDYLARDDLIIWCLTLSTNIWATLMVSFKAWKHRKCLNIMLRQGSKKTQLEKLMALLVESGAFYCVIWIGFLLIYALTRTGSFVMDGVMVQIAGIYPTILIVLVNFGKTHLDNEFGYNGDGLAMQRQEVTSVEAGMGTSQTSRVFDLNRMFITQGQSRDEAEESGFQEVDISDRKGPVTLV